MDTRKGASLATTKLAARTGLNQKGLGAILLLALLPVLIAIIFVVLLGLTTQQTLMGARQICRSELLSFEQKNSDQLMELQTLNIEIKGLRIEEVALRLQLVAALASENFVAAAAAQQKLAIIAQQFLEIEFVQKSILSSNSLAATALGLSLPIKIRKQTHDLQARLKNFVGISIEIPKTEINPLAVRPDRHGTKAPVYELEEPFIERQGAQAFWKIRISIDSNQWAHNWLTSNVVWKDSCGASLKKEQEKWQPVLITTKKDRS